jgi:hypothetical protein
VVLSGSRLGSADSRQFSTAGRVFDGSDRSADRFRSSPLEPNARRVFSRSSETLATLGSGWDRPSLGASWAHGKGRWGPNLGPSWAHEGTSLGPSCAHGGPSLGPSWAHGSPMMGEIVAVYWLECCRDRGGILLSWERCWEQDRGWIGAG